MSYATQIQRPAASPRPVPAASPRALTRREGLALAARFLHELEGQYLEVVLIPSRDPDCAMRGGMIRAAQMHNPEWYREFCGLYESRRKDLLKWREFKTAIKRRDTIRGLKELLDGRCQSVYAQRLRDFIRQEWKRFI